MLLSARTVVGVGEASFGTVSPGIIADYFSREKRGRILSFFYLAIPVGSALGYLFGGLLGHYAGWHAAFLVVSVPGILLSLPLYFLGEPLRGESDGIVEGRREEASATRSSGRRETAPTGRPGRPA